MIARNRREICTTLLRKQALDIIEAGINSVLPASLLKSALTYYPAQRKLTVLGSTYDASDGRIFVIGAGKAAGLMAQALETIIDPDHICDSVVNCVSANYGTRKIKIIEASHPVPDQRGVRGVKEMLALKSFYSINKNDLIICLISGGGSALLPCPADGITLQDKQKITQLLIDCGADIGEINSVRKHLSKVKGGQLGRFFQPATAVSLIISDVIGNSIETIASGPTAPDTSTFKDAFSVLIRYDLLPRAPRSVVDFLKKGCEGEIEETPKSLNNCANHIIADNRVALESMAEKAKEIGLSPLIATAGQNWETTAAALLRAREITDGKYADYNAILIGGETTPRLPADHGIGGRNQHYAAVSMTAIKEYPGEWVLASAGTDGCDFLPDIAGAIVDNNSLARAKEKNIDVQPYLDRYDSNTLLKRIGNSLIVTGATGTNVGDIMVYILKKGRQKQKK